VANDPITAGVGRWQCDQGHGLMLWGVDDFQRFRDALERAVDAPLGRKWLYAMADAEERIHSASPSVGWFRKRHRRQEALRLRRQHMGWGVLDVATKTITHGVASFIEIGAALGHEEHMSGQRFNVEWDQPANSTLRYALKPRHVEMSAAPTPPLFQWSSSARPTNDTWDHGVVLDRRSVGWFINDQRCFFIPSTVISYLAASLQAVKFAAPSIADVGLSVQGIVPEEEGVFAAMCWSAYQACSSSQRMVFFHTRGELASVIDAHHHRLGLGRVMVSEFHNAATFVLRGSGEHTPLTVGWLLALVTLGSGHRLQAHLVMETEGWRLQIESEKISYVDSKNGPPQP